MKHHDYVQATKLLESIPYSQHSDESRSLLSKAQELGDEVELLIADMDQAVSLKQLETLPATLTRLLKLRPGYLPAKELLDRINSYGSGERRSFRFSQSGELLPGNPEEALFHGVGRMMVMLLLFGVVVFAGTSWYVWSYLLDPLRTVQVEIDDPTVTVVIDDQTVALSEGKGEVRLRSGNHGWTALKEGLALKSAKFSVGKDHAGTLVIRLREDESIPVAALNDGPTTNSQPQVDPPQIEPVFELNTIANEQSLWVSPTGLRIYYERDGQIWLATRKSKTSKFSEGTALFLGRHPTLSAAETQIYFVVPGQLGELQVRRRANIDSPFGIATAVLTLVQNPSAKCPSLSVDGLSMVFTSRDSAGVHRIMLTERLTRSSEWEVAKSIKLVDHSEPDKLSWPRLIDGGKALLLNDESDSGGHRFVTFTSQGSDSYRKSSYLNDRNLSASDLSKLAGRSLSYCAATDELYFTSTRSQRFQRNADGLITDDWQIFRLTKVSQALPGNLAHFMKPLNASQKQDSGATAPKAGQLAGEKWAGNGLQMEFCWCPPGSFTMGSPASEPNRHENEGPVSVRLTSGFWQGKYEVTQQEWQAVMGTTIRQQATRSGKGISGEEGARFPMYFVDHTEATEFCIKLTETERRAGRVPVGWTYRLPSEAEWEYACRAGTTTATAFGNSLSSTQANFDGRFPYNGAEKGNIRLTETEVGSFQPNQWGFYDMHGNVHEWCADWYVEKLPGGQNPVVLQAASIRVYRGGSRYNFGEYCRSATRDMPTSHFPWFAIGFRVALGPDLQPQPFAVPTKTNASVATSATPKPPSPPSKPKLIPLYKIVFPSEVMLTANTDEVKQLQKAYPGKWNGKSGTHVAMLGYGFAEQQPGTALLRRYLVSPGRAHAFATRPINNPRFKEEGLGVWVSEQKSPGTSLWIGFAHNKGAPMEFDLESATASFKKIGYTPTSFQFYLFDKP